RGLDPELFGDDALELLVTTPVHPTPLLASAMRSNSRRSAGQVPREMVLDGKAAVNAQNLTGDVGGLGRGQEDDRRGHVSGRADPRDGRSLASPLQQLGR